jgi:hypothetical protein
MSKEKSQKRKFIEVARELGCKEDPRAFDRALKKIAKAPPPETVQERKKSKNDKLTE